MDNNNNDNNNNTNIQQKVIKPNSVSFQSLGLDKEILQGILRMGYKVPTPVQRKTLPLAFAGIDIVCMARTGSGKTLAFLLPMIHKLKQHESNTGIRAIVLSPTRELALQTFKFATDIAKFTNIRIISIVGGDGIEAQFDSLSNQPDAIIATPGRLMHHLNEINTFTLKHVQYLVFDEADRLFEMGFAEQLNEIVKHCQLERQTLLFSATMPKLLLQFSRAGLRDPQLIRLDTDVKMSDDLRIGFFNVRSNEKIAAFLYIIRKIIPKNQLSIIFTATKHHSEFLHGLLTHIGVTSTMIYGSMDQDARNFNLKSFRLGEINYLIVTDIAARGLDIPLLNNVINFHFPSSPKLFVHRCGRAARQGRIGFAFSIIEPDELPYVADVHRLLNIPITSASDDEKYTLDTMKPSYIHIGLIPQDIIDEENEFIKRLLVDNDSLSAQFKVSENGMKQYKRTRTEASNDSIKEIKLLIKNKSLQFIHPLIKGIDPIRCNQLAIDKSNYIQQLQTFRPLQTILETGIGTGLSNQSIKNKNKSGTNENNSLLIMKQLRYNNNSYLDRNRKKLLITNESDTNNDINQIDNEIINEDNDIKTNQLVLPIEKSRLSISERKKLKRKGYTQEDISKLTAQKLIDKQFNDDITNSYTDSNKRKVTKTFRDNKYYMTYGTEDERANYAEESLQPKSNLKSSEAQSAAMLESALLDLTGNTYLQDNTLENNKKKKITHWDEKKRKFVKQTIEEMAQSGRKGTKRLRSESGILVSSNKKKGEMYEKWKKKNHREIGVYNGVDNDDNYDNKPKPRYKVNNDIKNELKTIEQIKKEKNIKDKNAIKNLSKDKRAIVRKKLKDQHKGKGISKVDMKYYNNVKVKGFSNKRKRK